MSTPPRQDDDNRRRPDQSPDAAAADEWIRTNHYPRLEDEIKHYLGWRPRYKDR